MQCRPQVEEQGMGTDSQDNAQVVVAVYRRVDTKAQRVAALADKVEWVEAELALAALEEAVQAVADLEAVAWALAGLEQVLRA